jgi:hypothetical protein
LKRNNHRRSAAYLHAPECLELIDAARLRQ